MKTKKIAIVVFVFLCVTGMLYYGNLHAKGKKEIIFGFAKNPVITSTSFAGKGSASLQEIFYNAATEFENQYGYTLTLNLYSSPKFLFKALDNKEADFALPYLATYLTAKNQGLAISPVISYSATERKESRYCIYVHKDSRLKSVKDLRGKSFVSDAPIFMGKKDALPPKESYVYWIMVGKIFQNAGVNKPFKDFFKEFRVLFIPYESVDYAVLFKNFDAFFDSEASMISLRNYDKGFFDLVPLSCLTVPAMPPIFHRKDVPKDIVEKFKAHLLKPAKGTKAEKLTKKEFKGMTLFAVEEKDYAIYFKWLKEAEQKGWIREFDEIMKNMPKPGEKKKSPYIIEK